MSLKSHSPCAELELEKKKKKLAVRLRLTLDPPTGLRLLVVEDRDSGEPIIGCPANKEYIAIKGKISGERPFAGPRGPNFPSHSILTIYR